MRHSWLHACAILALALSGLAGCSAPTSDYPDAHLATGHALPGDLRLARSGDPGHQIVLDAAGMDSNPGEAEATRFRDQNGTYPPPQELHIAFLVRDSNASRGMVSLAARYSDAAEVDRMIAQDPDALCPPTPDQGMVLRDGAVLASIGTSSDDPVLTDAVRTLARSIQDATGARPICS